MRNNNGLDFLDLLNIMSFAIGIMNYGENITQGDMAEVAQALSENTSSAVADLHRHLEEQDAKIEKIINLLEGSME